MDWVIVSWATIWEDCVEKLSSHGVGGVIDCYVGTSVMYEKRRITMDGCACIYLLTNDVHARRSCMLCSIRRNVVPYS